MTLRQRIGAVRPEAAGFAAVLARGRLVRFSLPAPAMRTSKWIATVVVGLAFDAHAQSKSFDIDHLQLAITSGEFLGTEGRSTIEPWRFRVGAGYSYSNEPLVVDGAQGTHSLVEQRSLLHLFGAFALGSRFVVGADLPILFAQTGEVGAGAALGDLRLVGRARLFAGDHLDVAAIAALRLPTGDVDHFVGEGNVVFEPRGVVEWRGGPLRLALNLGALFRETRQFDDLVVGNELFASAALAVRPHPVVDGFVELHADTALSDRIFDRAATPVELLGGATVHAWGFATTGAVGVGLIEGFGDPKFRIVVSVAYQPPPRRVLSLPPAPRPLPPPKIAEPPPVVPAPVAQHLPDVDPEEPHVQVSDEAVELADPIFFDVNRKRIRSRFVPELIELARAVNKRPWIDILWIDGHADGTGKHQWNLALSQLRAEAVRRFLVAQGVAPERLRTLAYGDSKPWFSNAQQEGRAKNRRAAFLIQRRSENDVAQLSSTEVAR